MHVSDGFSKLVRAATIAAMVIVITLGLVRWLDTPSDVHAQGSGTVGLSTISFPVFKSQSGNFVSGGYWGCGTGTSGACPVFQSIGQSAHGLFYCNTGLVGTVSLEFPNNGTYKTLARANFPVSDNSCHQMQLGGYYPGLRARLASSFGSVTATYTATAGPIGFFAPAISTNGSSSPIACDLGTTASYASAYSGNGPAGPVVAGDTVVVCNLTISFQSAPTTGTILLSWATSGSCTSPTAGWEIYTTASTPQTLYFPNINLRTVTAAGSSSDYLCLTNNSGQAIYVTANFASVTGI